MKFERNEKEINEYIKNIREAVSNILDAETKSEREHLIEDAIGYLDELEEEVSNHFDDVTDLVNDWDDLAEAIGNITFDASRIEKIIDKY